MQRAYLAKTICVKIDNLVTIATTNRYRIKKTKQKWLLD